MAVPGYVLKNRHATQRRVEQFISPIYFTDVNLYGRLYPQRVDVPLLHYAAPGRITYDEAVKGTYVPASAGTTFGPTWSTHWFKIEVNIPLEWVGEEVRFRWESDSEALLWCDGYPIQAFANENRRTDATLSKSLKKDQLNQTFYVEMACNGCFGAPSKEYQISPTDPNATFVLKKVEIAVINWAVYDLFIDLTILHDMVQNLPENSNRGYQALYAANEIVNMCDFTNKQSLLDAHLKAKEFFSEKNGDSQHTVYAVGNCHIDTAWLWPYAETIRKCARSWSSSLRLVEQYPDWVFSFSQAQQSAWMKEHYPMLHEDIRAQVKKGRFVAIGGCWIEMDGNIPSGESMIRQMLYGQRFFEKEFGYRSTEFWLPDTFGYSAQMPQIAHICGMERFVTQKMSWSAVNKFPNNTFWWKGIDGTRVLSHFPPGDSYGMLCNVKEVLHTLDNFRDKGRSNRSLFLFGYGDGGQGPTEIMLEKLNRMKNVDGLPKVELKSVDEFFHDVEVHEGSKLVEWSGELYLELHNGTYTTHAQVKRANRKLEFLLRNVEAVASLNYVRLKRAYSHPGAEIERIWKLLCLNQFHDVLPGTSINIVYKDVKQMHADIKSTGSKLLKEAISLLPRVRNNLEACLFVNTLSWDRSAVVCQPATVSGLSPVHKKKKAASAVQQDMYGNTLMMCRTPSFGFNDGTEVEEIRDHVSVQKIDDVIEMKNKHIRVQIDCVGRITHLYTSNSSKNLIKEEHLGNQLVIFDDIPTYWDAWDVNDYHLETRKPIETALQYATIVEEGPLRATVQVSLKISDNSYMKQLIQLDSECPYLKFETEVEWHECHKFLKVEMPLSVRSPHATYEIQYGHVQRTTHLNTSWDWAQIEVCGHKWADLSEYNMGVAVLNDCKYGWNCIGSTLYLSLLRSSKNPDEKADMGTHTFTYAVMPHTGTFQDAGVIRAAYELNCPILVETIGTFDSPGENSSFIQIDNPAVILETLKKAEDSEAVILRFYEAFGGHGTANITVNFDFIEPAFCNGLEDTNEDDQVQVNDHTLTVNFTPFQIISIKLPIKN